MNSCEAMNTKKTYYDECTNTIKKNTLAKNQINNEKKKTIFIFCL